MTRLVFIVALAACACGPATGPLPAPRGPNATPVTPALVASDDDGFDPAADRPLCSSDVLAAVADGRSTAIMAAARRGANFRCGSASDPLPLDEAVNADRPDRVAALLAAGADPNARWHAHGDRLPLQAAIEAQMFGFGRLKHRADIVKTLLDHGADANARWCPFESRHRSDNSCRSDAGVTPLIMASAFGQVDSVALLLGAGADPSLRTWTGTRAIDVAHDTTTMALLLAHVLPDAVERRASALDYIGQWIAAPDPHRRSEPTPLMDAIARHPYEMLYIPPPPSPGGTPSADYSDYGHAQAARARAILELGADPNEHSRSGSFDDTPLGLAIRRNDDDVEMVELLLQYGADPNLRSCAGPTPTPATPCRTEVAPTALMWAASAGRDDLVDLLIRYGADVNLKDASGRTAANYADGPRAAAIRRRLVPPA